MFSPSKINHLECLKRILFIVRVIHWLFHSFILQIFVTPDSSSLESLYTRANKPRGLCFFPGSYKEVPRVWPKYRVQLQVIKLPLSSCFCHSISPSSANAAKNGLWRRLVNTVRSEHFCQLLLVFQGLQSTQYLRGTRLSAELRMLSSTFSTFFGLQLPRGSCPYLQTPIHFWIVNLSLEGSQK